MNVETTLFTPSTPITAPIAIIAARFHHDIVNRLEHGALQYFKKFAIIEPQVKTFYVPGAFELPVLAKELALQQHYAGILALGCVVRGGTPHFEYVAGECVHGLARVSVDMVIPIALGVLTTDTMEQAHARADGSEGNKGTEAASALLEMITLFQGLKKD